MVFRGESLERNGECFGWGVKGFLVSFFWSLGVGVK